MSLPKATLYYIFILYIYDRVAFILGKNFNIRFICKKCGGTGRRTGLNINLI